MSKPIVFGAAPYLNAAPLTDGLEDLPDVRLLDDHPSALSAHLKQGRADVGLLPVVDVLRDRSLVPVGELGVCSPGPVRSVLLRCHVPPQDVRRVAPDVASHTSNQLACVILTDHFGASVRLTSPGAADADAEVIIGDRALASPSSTMDLDLADVWRHMTGLPFVFARWVCRHDDERRETFARLAEEAFVRGVDARASMAERFAERLGLSSECCLDYITTCIHYRIEDREREAIHSFAARLHSLDPHRFDMHSEMTR